MRGADWDEKDGFEWTRRRKLAAGALVIIGICLAGYVVLDMYVFGIGEKNPAPQSAYDATVSPGQNGFGTGDETIRLHHDGGEEIATVNVELIIATKTAASDETLDVTWPNDGEFSAGETVTYTGTIPANATISLIWTSPEAGDRNILYEWDTGSSEESNLAPDLGQIGVITGRNERNGTSRILRPYTTQSNQGVPLAVLSLDVDPSPTHERSVRQSTRPHRFSAGTETA